MASVESVPAYMLPGVPVVQPPHLEGDPTLATEVLPGPPSLHSVQQAGLPRRDHKKSVTVLSYLPVSDPGTTYSGHMVTPMASTAEIDGSRRKRARLDKGSATSRAQRASARNLGAAAAASDPVLPAETMASSSQFIPDSDPPMVPADSDEPALSRSHSHSLFNADDESPPISNHRRSHAPRRDKGKGKERDGTIRVKEEPSAVSLAMTDVVPALSNEDHCSSCRSFGSLVYCDGCPRAFHLWCLNPPMEAIDLPAGDARWFCPSCVIEQRPKPRPNAALKFMSPLVEQLEWCIPVEFQLPQDIRTFFKDVATGSRGNYVDGLEIRQPRLNRHGQLEDRDPYRLKDKNGDPVLCFRCGTSALPPGTAASAPVAKRARRETRSASVNESGRCIVSCDYCHLHWHLDCLDPPLSYMPVWSKKWMCPNHADVTLQPKRRIPRTNATPIEITRPHQRNNGNIEIIRPESTPIVVPPKIAVDEVLINGRRYRVPEKIVTLDFWNKLGRTLSQTEEQSDPSSTLSSPLTSLSSLDEVEDISSFDPSAALFSLEDVQVAHLLCGLQLSRNSSAPLQGHGNGAVNGLHVTSLVEKGAQTDPDSGSPTEAKASVQTNGTSRRRPVGAQAKASTGDAGELFRGRRRAAKLAIQPGDEEIVPMDVDPIPATSTRTRRSLTRKADARKGTSQDHGVALGQLPQPNGSFIAGGQQSSETQGDPMADLSSASTSVRPRRARVPARRKQSPIVLTSGVPAVQDGNAPEESDAMGGEETAQPDISTSTAKRRKSVSRRRLVQKEVVPPADAVRATTPPPAKPVAHPTSPGPSTAKAAEPGPTATPSLKIRLPRFGSLNLPSAASTSEAARSTSPSRSAAQRSSSKTRTRRPRRKQTSTSLSFNGMNEGGSSLVIEG